MLLLLNLIVLKQRCLHTEVLLYSVATCAVDVLEYHYRIVTDITEVTQQCLQVTICGATLLVVRAT